MNEQRTLAQNNALHLYCQLIADSLNAAGYSIPEVLKHFKMEVPWTKENVKEILWRTAQQRMFSKHSTKQLLRQGEIDDIVDVITRFLELDFLELALILVQGIIELLIYMALIILMLLLRVLEE